MPKMNAIVKEKQTVCRELEFRPTTSPMVTVWDMVDTGEKWVTNRHSSYKKITHSSIMRLSRLLETWRGVTTGVYHNSKNGRRKYWVTITFTRYK